MSACTRYWKEQDQLGSSVNLNYKSKQTYGTVVGGIFSCVKSYFSHCSFSIQFYAWVFVPEYKKSLSTGGNLDRVAKHAMMCTVAERGKHHYSYDEYFLFSTLRSICCCFTRKYENGKKAGCCSRKLRRL